MRHHRFTAVLILCSTIHLPQPADGRVSPMAWASSALIVYYKCLRNAGRLWFYTNGKQQITGRQIQPHQTWASPDKHTHLRFPQGLITVQYSSAILKSCEGWCLGTLIYTQNRSLLENIWLLSLHFHKLRRLFHIWTICKGLVALKTTPEDYKLSSLPMCSMFCGANLNDSPAISCSPGPNALVIDYFKWSLLHLC